MGQVPLCKSKLEMGRVSFSQQLLYFSNQKRKIITLENNLIYDKI